MNKFLVRFFLLVLLAAAFASEVSAQQKRIIQLKDAVLKLKEAEDLFNTGHFDEASAITTLLLNDPSLTRTEKEQAILITAKINLELDKIDTVNSNIVSLYKLNPNYILNPVTVQQDLEKYFNNYYVIPRISVSAQVNSNTGLFKSIHSYSISDRINYTGKYGQVSSWGGGAQVLYSFKYHFFLGAGIQNNQYAFTRNLSGQDDLKISYQEHVSFVEIPFTAGKQFRIWRRYDVYAGCMAQVAKMFISSSSADIKAEYPIYETANDHSVAGAGSAEEKKINRKDARNNNFRYGGNVELSKRIHNLMFGFGAGYAWTKDLVNKPATRYSNESLIYSFNFIDDDFEMENMNVYFSVSYTFKYAIKKKQIKIS